MYNQGIIIDANVGSADGICLKKSSKNSHVGTFGKYHAENISSFAGIEAGFCKAVSAFLMGAANS